MNLRKLTLFVMALALLTAASPSFAMPSDADSNTWQTTPLFFPKDAWPWAIGIGATGDYVIDRELEDGSNLDETSWYGGNIYLDPVENVHLNIFVGAASLTVNHAKVNNAPDTTRVNLKTTDSEFAGGGSGKVDIIDFGVFADQPKMKLFATGGYRYTNADVSDVTSGSYDARSHALELELSEWQATVGISQRWDNPLAFIGWSGFSIVPYVGLQYSDVDLNVSGTSALPGDADPQTQSVATGHKDSEEIIGVAAGLQLIAWEDKLAVAVEGRFVTETAVSVSGHLRW